MVEKLATAQKETAKLVASSSSTPASEGCAICAGPHETYLCEGKGYYEQQEDVNFVGNRPINSYNNNNNAPWRNHPNFS